MTKLSDDRLHELHDAAIKAKLTPNRTALLGGIDDSISTALSHADNPSAQLLIDLQMLNDTESADGSIPLLSWLKAAHRLTAGLKQGQIFKEAVEGLGGVVDSTEGSVAPVKTVGYADPNIGKPPARNRYFEGREKLLKQLHSTLKTEDRPALTQAALAGLGGIGKTSLAAEYVHRFKDKYNLVWWLHAEGETVLESEFAQLAIELHRLGLLPKQVMEITVPEQVNVTRRWLVENEGWLLVFDNAASPESLEPYLVGEHKGHIIVTSRNPDWDEFVHDVLSVPVMERHESVAFILNRSGKTDEEAADALADELGDLPLALTQAAAYIKTRRISITKYLKMFRDKHSTLLAKPGPPRDYPDTVAATWRLSFEKMKEESEAAAQLLNIIAFLAPVNIPLLLFRNSTKHLPHELGETAQDEEGLLEVVWTLRRYSLVDAHEYDEQNIDSEGLSVHRLIQAVVRDRLTESEKRKWVGVAMRAVDEVVPRSSWKHKYRSRMESMQKLIESVVAHATSLQVAPIERIRLLTRIGMFLWSRGHLKQAAAKSKEAADSARLHLEAQDADLLDAVESHAVALHSLGGLAQPKVLLEEVLRVRCKEQGEEHSDTLDTQSSLAAVLSDQGRWSESRQLQEQALAVRLERKDSHTDTTHLMVGIAYTYAVEGKFAKAEELCRKALEIRCRVFGEGDSKVLGSQNQLAYIFYCQGNLVKARQLQEQTLGQLVQAFGEKHPTTLTGKSLHAKILSDLGELDAAENLQKQILKSRQEVHGDEYASTLGDMYSLAETYKLRGKNEQAKELHEKVFRARLKILGAEHRSTTSSQWALLGLQCSLTDVQPEAQLLIDSLSWLSDADESNLSAKQRTIRDKLPKMIETPTIPPDDH